MKRRPAHPRSALALKSRHRPSRSDWHRAALDFHCSVVLADGIKLRHSGNAQPTQNACEFIRSLLDRRAASPYSRWMSAPRSGDMQGPPRHLARADKNPSAASFSVRITNRAA